MDRNDPRGRRLYVLSGLLALVLLLFAGVLFDTQVRHHEEYLASSIRSIAREEKVEASRGVITDRSGRPLVSNRSTYDLTFDSSLLRAGEDENEAILRLLELCRSRGIAWNDSLPITQTSPFSYTVDSLSSVQKSRFLTYLKDLDGSQALLGAYLLQHPEVVSSGEDASEETDSAAPDAGADGEDAAEPTDAQKSAMLLEQLSTEDLSTQLLLDAGLTPTVLLQMMQEAFGLPASFTIQQARLVLGVQYELSVRQLVNTTAYVQAEDVDTELISITSDGNYAGAKITRSSVREYETTYAAHILGTVGKIASQEEFDALGDGYSYDDQVGKSGVEAAFEGYLKGTDGRRVVSTNEEGKITGEYYSKEPVPGNTVELTIDLELQQAVEDALAKTVTAMNEEDGVSTRGAAAVVLSTHGSEVLSLASYPTYAPASYSQDYAALESDPANPLWNRATSGTYAPGSTFKPMTAIAALQEGIITPRTEIRATHTWRYPGAPSSYANCWYAGSHGLINVTEAITNSCNYFFAQMGYELGMDTLREYAQAFGLGASTGIEIGDSAGTLPQNPQGEDQAPWAAFGQSSQAYTPLQLANYIATLVNGGDLYDVHLLKSVKTYDSSEVVAVGQAEPRSSLDISPANLEAVKQGMLGYTQPGGQVYHAFRSCVVQAGAKTGTAQLGGDLTNNGVFVCFAPYDDPEIVVSIVIEKGGSGAALASTAVEILNAYFTADETGTAILGENQLLQ